MTLRPAIRLGDVRWFRLEDVRLEFPTTFEAAALRCAAAAVEFLGRKPRPGDEFARDSAGNIVAARGSIIPPPRRRAEAPTLFTEGDS